MLSRANILFCYSRIPSFTNAVRDYVTAFGAYSAHHIHYLDLDSATLPHDLTPYDAIIFNYCYFARMLKMSEVMKAQLTAYKGAKIAILQDEYDYFLWHEKNLISIGINGIITCVPEAYWPEVFRDPYFRNVRFMNALTGYVPESLIGKRSTTPLDAREWMLGYRARPVPFTYGALTYEKYALGVAMEAHCKTHGIKANIAVSEEARIYGEAWPAFIANCRAMLGSESGSNLFDFAGTVRPAVEAYVKAHPAADFAEVHAKLMSEVDGSIRMNQISPRVFETIALGTALVMFEGEYSGIVKPWVHYIPLKKDYSNLTEVFAALSNTATLQTMIDNAYQDIIASGAYSFHSYIKSVDEWLEPMLGTRSAQEAIYGIVGWRLQTGVRFFEEARLPTATPLRHTDEVPNPVCSMHMNRDALRDQLKNAYAKMRYSRVGEKAHSWLENHPALYRPLRTVVRAITGGR